MKKNLDASALIQEAEDAGLSVHGGVIYYYTGACTGRSPDAKRIVKDSITVDDVDWAANDSLTEKEWENYLHRFESHLSNSEGLYLQDVVAVRDPKHALHVQVYTEEAVHSLFTRNMFVPYADDLHSFSFEPEWSVYHFPSLLEQPTVLISFSDKKVLISGTHYSGEIKKSIFTVLNFTLPVYHEPILPMHCSVNTDFDGTNPAIFFGLSGTGKTTLSSDSTRVLIGDDEHAWTSSGLTNFEGGCYAKTIKLSEADEPEIWGACHSPGTILENVVSIAGTPDFDDDKYTENCRASYSLSSLPNSDHLGYVHEHPENIIMLTCDAFGVLPPVAKLSVDEAVKHFSLGYTAKVAGTEAGVTEPIATFSPCFGGPFMPRAVEEYADILRAKLKEHQTQCWLVNTGWTGGAFGVGKRISIKNTRKIISAILDGTLQKCDVVNHDPTGLDIPIFNGLPKDVLFPELGWDDIDDYNSSVEKLNNLFTEKQKA